MPQLYNRIKQCVATLTLTQCAATNTNTVLMSVGRVMSVGLVMSVSLSIVNFVVRIVLTNCSRHRCCCVLIVACVLDTHPFQMSLLGM